MEFLWLLAVFLVPLMVVSPSLMDNWIDVPKVTLYRSLAALIFALWIIETGLKRPTIVASVASIPKLSPRLIKEWLIAQPGRGVLITAWILLASHLISTLLSPSISVSFWGREPALDGTGFYNTLSHFLLFLVVATHLKSPTQLWRLLGVITASGVVVGLYAALQYYGLNPFGIRPSGAGVVSSLGNPIFAGAYLLMVAPIALALALRTHAAPGPAARSILWVVPLTILVLGMAFIQSRGPWVGLIAGLTAFLALVGIAMGWRASLRTISMLAAASAITWAIVTFIPSPSDSADLGSRALSAGSAVISSLAAEIPVNEPQGQEGNPSALTAPSSMETRLLLWKSSVGMAIHRPWFQSENRPLPISLHLFGYGPEFFQYVFPLVHPRELRHLNVGNVLYGADAPHNYMLGRWVELGLFGLISHLALLGVFAVYGIRVILNKGTTTQVNQRLAMAAILSSMAGRAVEQLAGIPHLSDEALFWTLLAVGAALTRLVQEPTPEETSPRRVQTSFRTPHVTIPRVKAPVLQVSMTIVLASVVLGFTFVKNTNYVLAEIKATSASASSDDGQIEMAMSSIDSAIRLVPDVVRYHVIRANILDQSRRSTLAADDKALLAQEAYQANGSAVAINPFDTYSRLHFAESVLTLATLGQVGKGEEAIEEFQRLTYMQPRFWLSHFLLGRAYMELGDPASAIEAYSETIKLDPLSASFYDYRAGAYEMLGENGLALEDYFSMLQLSPDDPATLANKGIVLFRMGRLEEAIQDFDRAIEIHLQTIINLENLTVEGNLNELNKVSPRLALAYSNRGSAYYQLGRPKKAIEDYDRAIQLSPQSAAFYFNRSAAYEFLRRDAKAQQDFDRAIQLGFDPAPLGQN